MTAKEYDILFEETKSFVEYIDGWLYELKHATNYSDHEQAILDTRKFAIMRLRSRVSKEQVSKEMTDRVSDTFSEIEYR